MQNQQNEKILSIEHLKYIYILEAQSVIRMLNQRFAENKSLRELKLLQSTNICWRLSSFCH